MDFRLAETGNGYYLLKKNNLHYFTYLKNVPNIDAQYSEYEDYLSKDVMALCLNEGYGLYPIKIRKCKYIFINPIFDDMGLVASMIDFRELFNRWFSLSKNKYSELPVLSTYIEILKNYLAELKAMQNEKA